MDNRSASSERVYTDAEGRNFHYHYFDNGRKALAVHFSAFFGEWGDTPRYKHIFGGYFHRLKMLSSDQSVNWLFLCDAYGADENGTYYIGKAGDRFVDRAMTSILEDVGVGTIYQSSSLVMLGSSMGATAALRYGLRHDAAGVIAISPHIDLDTSARLQDRERHVAWVLDGGDTQARENFATTREINILVDRRLETKSTLPDLFVQTCCDDHGVYREQVVPLVEKWSCGGRVFCDVRRFGGHTSAYATRALLLNAVHQMMVGKPLHVRRYRWSNEFSELKRVRRVSDWTLSLVKAVGRKLLRRGT